MLSCGGKAMKKIPLLAHQKNEVLRTIQTKGLNPVDFEWQEGKSRHKRIPKIAILVHRPTGYYFKFDYDPDGFYFAIYSPGDDSIDCQTNSDDWESMIGHFEEWLQSIDCQTSTPDLWSAFRKESQLIKATSEAQIDNSPFGAREKEKVAQYIAEIKQHLLANMELTGQQQEALNARLDYLKEASERLGRKDWLNILIGTLLGTAIQLEFTRAC
jgi:hypothetical protein